MAVKRCTKCGEEKNLEEDFHKDASRPDGHKSACKKCRADNRVEGVRPRRVRTVIPPPPPLTAEEERTMQSLAKQTAIRQLITNHQREFMVLVDREYRRLGVTQQWRQIV